MRSMLPAAIALAAGMALAFVVGVSLPTTERATMAQNNVALPGLWNGACLPPARMMARLELLFGTNKRDGGTVSDAEWLAFLGSEVTPRFPDGLTVLAGVGQWRNAQGQISRESSRVLLIWHASSEQSERNVAAIREAYKQRFAQESVMRVRGSGCVDF